MNTGHWTAVMAAATMVLCPRGLQSQSEASDPSLHAECQQWAAALINGPHSPQYSAATVSIRYCELSGPPAIVSWWNSVAPDTAELDMLVEASNRILDQRILSAAISTAHNTSRPSTIRLSALRVLATYFYPGIWVDLPRLQNASDTALVTLGRMLHYNPVEGPQPLEPSYLEQITSAVQALASSDPDPGITNAAHFLRQGFYYLRPETISLDHAMIKLKYLCHNRFEVRSSADIGIILTYEIEGTIEHGQISIGSPRGKRPYNEVIHSAGHEGTMHLYYNDQLVATERNKGKACKK